MSIVGLGVLLSSLGAEVPASAADGSTADLKLGTTQQIEFAAYKSAVGSWPDQHEWRRGRVNASLRVYDRWRAVVEYDFATHSGLTEAHLAFDDHSRNALILGQTKQPFGLDASAGDKNGVFMERGLPYALAPRRAPGIVLLTYRSRWTASAGAFSRPLGPVQAGDEGVASAARFTWTPVNRPDQIVHVGLGLNWREPPRDNSSNASGAKFSTVRFRSRPESDDAAHNLVDTGEIRNVGSYHMLGLEFGSRTGPVALQAEYQWLHVGRNGARSAHFSGWYAQLAYSLTGEVRQYRTDHGTFESIQPAREVGKGGYGAFETALRVSSADLEDIGIDGGRATDAAVALNWYLNSQWRVAANLIKVLECHGGPVSGQEPTVYQIRVQLAL
jgi:phosphate-selective porin OprO/OprP